MPDVFISYKREDQEDRGRVTPIARGLEAAGYEVFYDVQVPPGSSWESFLKDKIEAAGCVIVLWSRASVESDWVKEEAELAKNAGKLVPAFVDHVPAPFGFGRVEGAELFDWDGSPEHEEWRRLVAAVAAKLERPVPPPPPPPVVPGPKSRRALVLAALVLLAVAVAAISIPAIRDWLQPSPPQPSADEQAWRSARGADTIEGYASYLRAHPNGAYSAKADHAAYQIGAQRRSTQALEAYVRMIPSGRHVDAARELIARLRQRGETASFADIPTRRFTALGVRITNVRLSPPPPARLSTGQQVNAEFDYSVTTGRNVHIWVRPVTEGSGACSYGASGSPKYSDTGDGRGWFTMRGDGCATTRITGVHFKVGDVADRDRTEQFVIPVSYTLR